MALTTYKPAYTASQGLVISPENVATSASLTAGVQSTVISNISSLYSDVLVSGVWVCGTTPTINTQAQIWVFAPYVDDLASGAGYANPLIATAQAVSFLSAGYVASALKLGAILSVDTATSNTGYYCAPFSIAALFGGRMPTRWGIFITHNTGANSFATAGNHLWRWIGIKDTGDTP